MVEYLIYEERLASRKHIEVFDLPVLKTSAR
jgi:hypothetical protein